LFIFNKFEANQVFKVGFVLVSFFMKKKIIFHRRKHQLTNHDEDSEENADLLKTKQSKIHESTENESLNTSTEFNLTKNGPFFSFLQSYNV
jgi:hypothetical protein